MGCSLSFYIEMDKFLGRISPMSWGTVSQQHFITAFGRVLEIEIMPANIFVPSPQHYFSPSLMVRFTSIYLHCTVDLLHEYQAHQLVRQCHAAEGQLRIRSAKNRIR